MRVANVITSAAFRNALWSRSVLIGYLPSCGSTIERNTYTYSWWCAKQMVTEDLLGATVGHTGDL